MTEKKAREMFPVWASSDAVRIVDEPSEQEKIPTRLLLSLKKEKFIKDHGILIVVALIGLLLSAAVGVITGSIVRRNTIAEMEHQYRAQMQAYLDQQEQQRMASELVTGEKSRQAGMDLEAREIARVLYGVKDNSEKDLRTAVWCILNRVDSNAYPGNVYQVCCQSDQWMGYSPENPVLDNLYKIAREELEVWYGGTRPCDIGYVFLKWSPKKIVLRNDWKDDDYADTWRYGQQ